jgi:hypothetical protein
MMHRVMLSEYPSDWSLLFGFARYLSRSYVKRVTEGVPKTSDKLRTNALLTKVKGKEQAQTSAGSVAAKLKLSRSLNRDDAAAASAGSFESSLARTTVIPIPQG